MKKSLALLLSVAAFLAASTEVHSRVFDEVPTDQLNPDYDESGDEISVRLEGLRASYEYALTHGYDSKSKVVVVQRRGRFIVVSFIPEKGSRTLGGGGHFVFDPVARRIVYVGVED